MTEIKGNYDASVDLSLAELLAMGRAAGADIPAGAGAPSGAGDGATIRRLRWSPTGEARP